MLPHIEELQRSQAGGSGRAPACTGGGDAEYTSRAAWVGVCVCVCLGQDVWACEMENATEGCVRVTYTEQNDGVEPVPAWGEWRGPYSRTLPSPEWTQYVNQLNYDGTALVRQPLFHNLDRAAGAVRHNLTLPLRAATDPVTTTTTTTTTGQVDDVAHALSVTLNAEHAQHAVHSGRVRVAYCGFEGAGCGCSVAAGVARELTVGGDTWTWADHTDGSARCLTPSMVERSDSPLFIPGQHEHTTTQVWYRAERPQPGLE